MENEAHIIRLAQAGDEQAFGQLVHAYHDRVAGLLMRMLRNPDMAQELEQQTWIKVWKHLPRFRGQSAFFTWLYSIATRTALDHLRKVKRRGEVEYLDERAAPSSAEHLRPDRALARQELSDRIQQAMDRLKDKHRTVLVLREVEGLSYEEIAEVVHCRVGTVMSRLFHARKQMQLTLKGNTP